MPEIVAKAGMSIRKPAEIVFGAFIDPTVTTHFWFTKSSGRLEKGQTVRWTWEMYGMSTEVQAVEIEKDRRILVEWSHYGKSCIEWIFTARGPEETFVSVRNWGFKGSADEQWEAALGSTEGFALMLAGLKSWLEHGIALRLVHDRFPEARVA
jgi:uncharacterized protein YndB with AHSA1/START domain